MKILADLAVNTTNNININQSNIDMKGYVGFFKIATTYFDPCLGPSSGNRHLIHLVLMKCSNMDQNQQVSCHKTGFEQQREQN
jgi:hypothetical protein